MPEGPEVRIITDQLSAALKNAMLESVMVLSGRYERHGGPPGLDSMMLPTRITGVDCHGKLIWFATETASNEVMIIWNTLGMTGFWSKKKEDHARIRFETSAGDFYFCDPRNFGTMHLDRSLIQHADKLRTLGVDLLRGRVDDGQFKKIMLKRAKKTIVEALMDQSVTAGVGNYIKCEALYHTGISPHRITKDLTDDEFQRLQASLANVMASSYAAKGHSMSDFRDIEGEKGSYKFELAVYNRSKDPKGIPVIREETKDGRTTHWVPSVQK